MKPWLRFLLFVIGCTAVLAAWPGYRYYKLVQAERQCEENRLEVCLAIAKWEMANYESYGEAEYSVENTNLAMYIKAGHLDKIPVNPYTSRHIRFVQPGESPTPGDMLFVPAQLKIQPRGAYLEDEDGNMVPMFLESGENNDFYLVVFSLRSYSEKSLKTFCDIDGDNQLDTVEGIYSLGRRSGKYTCVSESFIDALKRAGYPAEAVPKPSRFESMLPVAKYLLGLDPV